MGLVNLDVKLGAELHIAVNDEEVFTCGLQEDTSFDAVSVHDTVTVEGIMYAYVQPCVILGIKVENIDDVTVRVSNDNDCRIVVAVLGENGEYSEPVLEELVRADGDAEKTFKLS